MVRPGAETVNLRGVGAGWVVVALGSNLGDRAAHLEGARRGLFAGGFRWILASPVEQTVPLPGSAPGQGPRPDGGARSRHAGARVRSTSIWCSSGT